MTEMQEKVTINIDGKAVQVKKGITVAAALLEHGAKPFRRSPENGEPRAPHCFMGVCYECLVTIDGVANSQGCLEVVRDNMVINHQRDVVTPPEYPAEDSAKYTVKNSGMLPQGDVVLVGNGPLLLLEAARLIKHDLSIKAILDTGPALPSWQALKSLPKVLQRADYLLKGAAMLAACKRRRVPYYHNVRDIRAQGEDTLSGVTARAGNVSLSLPAQVLLTHFGILPSTALFNQAGCRLDWNKIQRYWQPVTDRWGRTSKFRIFATGDGAGVEGARAAALRGRLTALEIAASLGRIPVSVRDSKAEPLHRRLRRELAPRPFIEALYSPAPDWFAPDPDVLICRCEHVTIGDVMGAIRMGCHGVNEIKALVRSGMGHCQGRMCGSGLAEVVARVLDYQSEDLEPLRIRPPFKPVPLKELAQLTALNKS